MAGLLLFSAALYAAGYLPIVARARYLYPVYIILLVSGGKLLDRLAKNSGWGNRFVLAAFLSCSFLITPAVNIVQSINYGRGMMSFSQDFARRFGKGRTLASSTRWMESLYAAYHTGSRYVGQAEPDINAHDLAERLADFHADYFFSWSERPLEPQGWREVSGGKYHGLLIFAPPASEPKS